MKTQILKGWRVESDGDFHSKNPSCRKIKSVFREVKWCFNLLKPEFTIVFFIHYKPRIAVAILDL